MYYTFIFASVGKWNIFSIEFSKWRKKKRFQFLFFSLSNVRENEDCRYLVLFEYDLAIGLFFFYTYRYKKANVVRKKEEWIKRNNYVDPNSGIVAKKHPWMWKKNHAPILTHLSLSLFKKKRFEKNTRSKLKIYILIKTLMNVKKNLNFFFDEMEKMHLKHDVHSDAYNKWKKKKLIFMTLYTNVCRFFFSFLTVLIWQWI